MQQQQGEELAKARIETAKQEIAVCINKLNSARTELTIACNSQEWDEEAVYDIDEVIRNLGELLADLVIRYDS